MELYIYQHKSWPHFTWNNDSLVLTLGQVRNMQGKIMGKMESLGFDLRNEAVLETLTVDVLKSSEIEGEVLNMEQVRSSIARNLGLDIPGMVSSDRDVDGIVELMMDATRHYKKELSPERLFDWHSSLFPTGRHGMHKITVGDWRKDAKVPMQVVSGAIGREKVHFQAPPASDLEAEMNSYITWFNNEDTLDPVIKAALDHLWFVTIHPFDDGNGRIARALTDMLLARSDGSPQRFYSMSAQIRLERKAYYEILEGTQKGDLDVTEWLQWFLNCLMNSLNSTETTLAKVLCKSQFWQEHSSTTLNDRQKLLLSKLLDGFIGKLTSSKWAKIARCSPDTALRDIQDLIIKGILRKEPAGGRSTNYELADP